MTTDKTRKPSVALIACWLSAICQLSLLGSQGTAETPSIGTVIEFGASSFDLRVDKEIPAQSDDTIALNSIPWIGEAMSSEPLFNGTIFHLVDAVDDDGNEFSWRPDRAEFGADVGLPARYQPFGYQVVKQGVSYLFLPEHSDAYFGSCVYNNFRDQLRYCSVTVRYAPDNELRLFVGSSQLGKSGVPDFTEIAVRAHRFVRCQLDVTPPSSDRLTRPQHETIAEFRSSCEPTTS